MSRKLEILNIASVVALLLFCAKGVAEAGDALAIGYNKDGVWTAATYYCSSTPKGGADYKNEADARAEAERDLKKRASEGIVRSEILSASDRTGHFAYARGKAKQEGDHVHVVGFGPTKPEAEKQAREELNRKGAKLEQEIVFQYFSHGADAKSPRAKK
jgi:hypothetical protein